MKSIVLWYILCWESCIKPGVGGGDCWSENHAMRACVLMERKWQFSTLLDEDKYYCC